MMNEYEIDAFLSEIIAEMELIRVYQNEPVKLTRSQENEIKKRSKPEQEELRKKYLAEAEEHKRARVFLLLCALEDKLKTSDLPEETKQHMQNIMDSVKNNNLRLTPETFTKLNEEKEKQNEETPKDNFDDKVNTVAAGAVAVLVASSVVAAGIAAVKEPQQTPVVAVEEAPKTIDHVGNLPVLSEKADPVYSEKVVKVAEKTFKKVAPKKKEPTSLVEIRTAKNITNAEKKYATAAFLEKHPEIKKDQEVQYKLVGDKAVEKAIARHNRKLAKMEKANQKYLTASKTAGTFDRTVERHEAQNSPQTKETPKVEFKRPVYNPKEAIVMKKVKKIKESAGIALTHQEILERLNNPTMYRIYDEYVRAHKPEYFENETKEEERKAKIAQVRIQRKLEQKRKEAEVQKEKGSITPKEKKAIEKEVNEQFNSSLRKLLSHYNGPKTNAIIHSQNVNERGAA
ncbi:MAG: hypothetical protein J6P93_04315 [Alphaproteobacteria bacterium]|nr:hypothetical protein [Alphaproteobacteria bacterium]